ncbi:MAG: hypothetical protein KDI50_06030 [Candidatus Competibacteraceae bacterium]|nr:hypothetical protein [Candidatus Competibacteraceae bacterium]
MNSQPPSKALNRAWRALSPEQRRQHQTRAKIAPNKRAGTPRGKARY